MCCAGNYIINEILKVKHIDHVVECEKKNKFTRSMRDYKCVFNRKTYLHTANGFKYCFEEVIRNGFKNATKYVIRYLRNVF